MKIAIILNTNQLGGAERSIIEQFSLFPRKKELVFLYPRLKSPSDTLEKFLKDKGFSHQETFEFPRFIYQLSKEDFFKVLLLPIFIFRLLVCFFEWDRHFSKFDYIYINGIKVAFPVFFWATLKRKKKLIIWHFRDFPSTSFFKVISILVKLLPNSRKCIRLIANSESVRDKLKYFFPQYEMDVIYNLPGKLSERGVIKKIKYIGLASMLAPWKGIHDVLMTFAIYKEELKKLGIEQVYIYGENIYQTHGKHRSYREDLEEIMEKYLSDFVTFKGVASPENIFSEIDLLIHSSIKPEPFGRVIVESFKARVPVISTGLGGAGEIIKNGFNGLTYTPYDQKGLVKNIKDLATSEKLREYLINNGVQKAQEVEAGIEYKSNQVLSHFSR